MLRRRAYGRPRDASERLRRISKEILGSRAHTSSLAAGKHGKLFMIAVNSLEIDICGAYVSDQSCKISTLQTFTEDREELYRTPHSEENEVHFGDPVPGSRSRLFVEAANSERVRRSPKVLRRAKKGWHGGLESGRGKRAIPGSSDASDRRARRAGHSSILASRADGLSLPLPLLVFFLLSPCELFVFLFSLSLLLRVSSSKKDRSCSDSTPRFVYR